MKRFQLTPAAQQDLREIADFISKDNPQAAHRVVTRLKMVCRTTLVKFPECGTKCDEYSPGMRCFSVGNYVIFFRGRKPVEILRIVYGSRDFGELEFLT
ncbi:MAG: type II toxin-antitoxin system RelE/ParE family toxin [Planctomycetaceae bacterium]|nr:type II toxin-antitoxin system RelE/ParE family toxin [Planctomycetaceae bacterium]